ncbi:MAG TPA: PD-(D/E)XK nuclease family protein [Burkholderiales bacterium]|jgi:probable DNA repair protein
MAAGDITRQDLFTRLAAGHAAGITVVTPNRRLAQVLKAEFDALQAGRNLPSWEDADILPVGAFIQRLYEDALYPAGPAGGVADLPQLLSPAQERALWESVLADAPLLSVSQAAANCAEAWRLAHAWRIDGVLEKFAGNEDTRAFAGWAREYGKRCKERFIDAPLLFDASFIHQIKKPKLLVAYGFDILPPQTRDFLANFETVSCGPAKKTSKALKTSFPSARHELEAAAQWARARLEGGIAAGKSPRIGVVVPDLQLRRKEVARVFSDVLCPGWNLPGAEKKAMPFDISIGEPLDGFAIVDIALGILELSFQEFEFATASKLIRSPFIGGAEAEFAARALLDAELRGELPPRLTLPKLVGAVQACPLLRSLLENIFNLGKDAKENFPHFWAQHFTALLAAAGFPGGRELDSGEFQARAKFNEALAEFARLGLVSGKMSFGAALAQLRRICAETLFQPETPAAPIQVGGILESAGLEFDCLWVSGLTEDAWPLPARANPFLPVALQKKAGIPEAAAETSLALDRRITEGWLGAAAEVVFSRAAKEKDRDLLPSPLIAHIPEGKTEMEGLPSWRDLIFHSGATETIADGKAPGLHSKTVKGGTRVLADQAACPFRAFAHHRLGAEGLDAPAEGLDALQRGNLLHKLMAGIWKEVKTKEGLDGDLSLVISRSAEKAIHELKIEGRFAELEKQRLVRLAGEWLEIERGRKPFEVVQIEQKRPIAIGGLSFDGRIDRMDKLLEGESAGTHALIDYKTGSRVTPNDWLRERPDEPQLPLYAVTAEENVSVVAFAKLKTGDMKFAGLSMHEKEIPGVRQAKSWGGLMASWTRELESLAAGFAQGDARVDPKKGFATCRHCDLQPLCRVHERLNALDEGEEEDRE